MYFCFRMVVLVGLSWKTLRIPSMLGRPATYQGYYVSFGTIRLPEEHHTRGYKTPIHQVYHPRERRGRFWGGALALVIL